MRGRVWLVCSSLSLIAFPAIAQQNRAPQASIEGRTFSADGQPLRKTTLTLHAYSKSETITATSDEQGYFAITGLEPGPWVLLADHAGYLQSAYGMQRIPGNGAIGDPVIHLDAGQHLAGIDMQLRPQAVVFGKLTDEDGDPMRGYRVTALLKVRGQKSQDSAAAAMRSRTTKAIFVSQLPKGTPTTFPSHPCLRI